MSEDRAGGTGRTELYAKFMRAVTENNDSALKELILQTDKAGELDEKLLRDGLQNAAREGLEASARVLLEHGASTDAVEVRSAPALWQAVEQEPESEGRIQVVRLLLHGSFPGRRPDLEWKNDNGETIAIVAAVRGHLETLKILLEAGANINARDQHRGTVLHVLAKDGVIKWNEGIVSLILEHHVDLEARDTEQRTAVHWAAENGKEILMQQLLSKMQYKGSSLNIRDHCGSTALILACSSTPANPSIVEALLRHGADPFKRADGGLTPLHLSALNQSSLAILHLLLNENPDLINAQTSQGATALHFAAEAGKLDVVQCLASWPGANIDCKDIYYMNPLLRAVEYGQMAVVEILARCNNAEQLPQDVRDALQTFEGTIVDFKSSGSPSILRQDFSIFDIIYGKQDTGEYLVSTQVDQTPSKSKSRSQLSGDGEPRPDALFRWIHLPANNTVWTGAVFEKFFLERGGSDISGFKGSLKAFDLQRRGPGNRSHFMEPFCGRFKRENDVTKTWGHTANTRRLTRSTASETVSRGDVTGKYNATVGGEESNAESQANENSATNSDIHVVPSKLADDLSRSDHGHTNTSEPPQEESIKRPQSNDRNSSALNASLGSYLTVFMPYLHFETEERRQEMKAAVQKTEVQPTSSAMPPPKSVDEALIRAYLHGTSGLHIRRTLDQFYLYGMDTEDDDSGQVIARYWRNRGKEEKIFMVDQLWICILSSGFILTSFPRRWRQEPYDPLNVLEDVLDELNSSSGPAIRSVYQLALHIITRCSGTFGRHRRWDEDYQFLQGFERRVGECKTDQAALDKLFSRDSAEIDQWFKARRADSKKSTDSAHNSDGYPDAVSRLIRVKKEIDLLEEIKDVHDESNMISLVLEQQRSILPTLGAEVEQEIREQMENGHLDGDTGEEEIEEHKKKWAELKEYIVSALERVARIRKLARKIEKSVLHLLDLKQKQSNALEARFARDQAEGTVRQGQITTVFTMVTVIFLPLEFLISFFSVQIQEFPRQNGLLQIGFVSKWVFGCGAAVALILILFAFSVNPLNAIRRHVKGLFDRKRPERQELTASTNESASFSTGASPSTSREGPSFQGKGNDLRLRAFQKPHY